MLPLWLSGSPATKLGSVNGKQPQLRTAVSSSSNHLPGETQHPPHHPQPILSE
jgi:hypothetical protein